MINIEEGNTKCYENRETILHSGWNSGQHFKKCVDIWAMFFWKLDLESVQPLTLYCSFSYIRMFTLADHIIVQSVPHSSLWKGDACRPQCGWIYNFCSFLQEDHPFLPHLKCCPSGPRDFFAQWRVSGNVCLFWVAALRALVWILYFLSPFTTASLCCRWRLLFHLGPEQGLFRVELQLTHNGQVKWVRSKLLLLLSLWDLGELFL